MTKDCNASGQQIDLDVFISERIRSLRSFMSCSAADLDRIAGFNIGTTTRLERQVQRIYASHLYRICCATGVAIDFFYHRNVEIETSTSQYEQEKFRLLDAYGRLENSTAKRDIFELVEAIANESEHVQT